MVFLAPDDELLNIGTFNPLMLPNLMEWLQAERGVYQDNALTTPAVADGDPVGGWVEQSGFGKNALQAGPTLRPLLKLGANGIAGKPALWFDRINDYLATPNWNVALTQPVTYYVVAKCATKYAGAYQAMISSLDGAHHMTVGLDNNNPERYLVNSINLGQELVASTVNLTPHVYTAVFNGVNSKFYVDGEDRLDTNQTGGTWTSLAVGCYPGPSLYWGGLVSEILVYQALHTPAQRLQVERYLAGKYRLYDLNLTFDGDSLTAGTGSTAGNSYPEQLEALLARNASGLSAAVSGQTIANMNTRYAAFVAPTYDTNFSKRLLLPWGGTNDIALDNVDAATFEARIITCWTNARATGWKFPAFTVMNRGNFTAGQQIVQGDVNTWIRANWPTYADGLVDVQANPHLQNTADPTYFDPDTIHLKDAGYAVVAGLAQTWVNTQ